MNLVDSTIFLLYMLILIGVGYYHFKKNKNNEDYYIGGRSMDATHVGLSVVATDVGGGFSIGLGGLGFAMGLSGTWLLFTGLIGAWLVAVFVIPKIKSVDRDNQMYTYPDMLRFKYNENVAVVAAVISGIGYLGFTAAQMLAGAKLASATLVTEAPLGLSELEFALLLMAVIVIIYTVIGGLKAVIYTDSIQWIVLLVGLIFITIPLTLYEIGGFSKLVKILPESYFTLTNISLITFINWMITIIPIWLIGMTLYQRIYACKNEKEAKKAWFIAGLFEYPIMAFTGVFLGMCAKALIPEAEPEMGIPLLIKDILPIGITGIVVASYFSAIMSTADSCLMASSGNFVNDIIQKYFIKNASDKKLIIISQVTTLVIGIIAVIIAGSFEKVLELILYSYQFMVAGLFVPTLGAYFFKKRSSAGAFWAMISGGLLTIALETKIFILPQHINSLGLDSCFYGILLSAVVFFTLPRLCPEKIDV